ncbi:hypothetical protein ABPG73_022500 [Tetrahymena malaccensis]
MKMINSKTKITLMLLIFLLTISKIFANPVLDKINEREIKIIKQKNNQTENDGSQRKLQSSTIRFSYDDQELRAYNNTLHTKIILNALNVAFNFYEQFVQVKNPILDELEVQDCYFGPLPIQFKKTIKNSDMHFILGLTLDMKEDWIAKAGACSLLYPDNRPVVGFIVYNLKFLPSQDKVSFSNFEYDKLIKVTIHEIFHALVFSESLYKYYVDITPEQYGTNKDGTPFLALPNILSFAQQHFGCNEITQVYLEESGQQGTAGSHWRKSLFYQDLMTGYILAGDVTWSGINNALLKDSGWYKVQMDFHDRLFWGKNQGCDFYFKTCKAEPRPKEFCDLSNIEYPKTGFNYEGYNFKCQQTLLDKECGFQISLDNKSCYGRVDKFNSEENIMEKAGSSFEWNSKGVTSSLSPIGSVPFTDSYQAQCYPQKCVQNGDKMSVELTIGSKINQIQRVICEEDGQILKVEGYNGEIVCPKIQDFCEQQFNCKNHCSGRGFCMNQKCVCAKGYSGEDCSIINVDEIQVLDILDPFCTIYNDKNECIKCSENFSLIGNSCQMNTSSQIYDIEQICIYLINLDLFQADMLKYTVIARSVENSRFELDTQNIVPLHSNPSSNHGFFDRQSKILANPVLDKINQREIKIIKQKNNQTENDGSQRNLKSSTIRFSYDDQDLRKYNNALHIKVILNALKVAFNFYEQFVQVKNPVLDELEVEDCYFGSLPIEYKKTIKNSDMHFILSLRLDLKGDWIAKAGACSLLYPDNRPVVGFIVYNLKFLPTQDELSFSNFQYDELIKVTIHEMLHALAFSDKLYKYYVDITPEQYGTNKDGASFLALPNILSFAQQHFGCNEITQGHVSNMKSSNLLIFEQTEFNAKNKHFKFPKSVKGKIGTVFIIFNILIAICNLIIVLYMTCNYCDTQILTLAIAALLFGLLNLALLIKDMFWSSGFLHFSVIFNVILCILSIAGVIIINQERFCTLIVCTKGVDEIDVLSNNPFARNSKYCSDVDKQAEEIYLRMILKAGYSNTMQIDAAWPLAFGIIQIVLCFIQSIVNFFSLYKFGCPPSKDSSTLEGYTNALREVLDVSLSLQDFPSEIVEKHNKPEVELHGYNKTTKNLVLHPIYLARSDKEKCLVEPSVNSCRISFLLKKNDELDILIASRFSQYFMVRADQFQILRRKAVTGYDVSFLITNEHLEKFQKKELIQYIIDFVGNVEKDLSDIKLNIISQARKSATFYAKQISKDIN